ncbi:MAG: ribonuclease P protein component [Saprospiraceae bacterium]
MKRFTLSKQERLSSRKEIEILFAEGHSLTKYPVRLVWRDTTTPLPGEAPVRMMFSVSKKKFPKAVDRNRAKRLMREGYRLLKPNVFSIVPVQKSYHLALIYTGSELLDFLTIQKSISIALERWKQKCQQETR